MSQRGDFLGLNEERFEARWSSNETFLWSWTASTGEALKFGGTQTAEDFEGAWDLAITL